MGSVTEHQEQELTILHFNDVVRPKSLILSDTINALT